MPWRPHTHTWNETERYGKSEWGGQVGSVWEYPCGNGSSHWFPGPWWPKAQTQAAHFPSNIVLELIDTGWVHITIITLNLRYPRETEELKWMRLVELADPMERYPRCWLGFKGSPSFSPGFSSRGRRERKERWEGVGADKSILHFWPKRILWWSDSEMPWGRRGRKSLGRIELLCFLVVPLDVLPQLPG